MEPGSHIVFAPFRLDLRNERLWLDERAIALTPKAFAVLKCLVERHSQLVTKEELLNVVWPKTYVTDAAVKVCIGELRKALGDDAKRPRFIETAHRRGYRFIGPITEERGEKRKVMPSYTTSATASGRFSVPLRLRLSPPTGLVGREANITRLRGWLERALEGERQAVFITGEAGIGKTALVESFLFDAARDSQVWIAQGQCLEQYGAGEAYLPVLEAVSRLCQEPGRERLVELLRRHAPTWLQQMPWLASDADREAPPSVTRERMLREMAEALESLTCETPLVLALEDLHWSDYSTLDLISYLARRRERARLLVVGTYRPVEALLSEHPIENIKQELQVHNQCAELPLEYLTKDAVREYLAARFPQLPAELAQLIHSRTGGNPLFMVNAVDYLLAEGAMVERDGRWEMKVAVEKIEVGVPESIKQMIEKQIDRLGRARQRMLEAAAVAGAEFSSAAVAAALGEDAAQIEEQCEELQRRRQFIQPLGVVEAPDGTEAVRYGFIHALYQNALYDRIAPARRSQLHLKIGERGESVYGERAAEIAAELAMHFEQGRDFERAVNYLRQAAENANRRF
ncbi:MAG TPA: AAA family ATPase, partial [Blastocatellia bacterium]|nr:AAA family ATPase [Blastocatellia bacterium]